MATNDKAAHISLSIPAERPEPPPSADGFQFMSDTFTLPQNGQSTTSAQIPISQPYPGLSCY